MGTGLQKFHNYIFFFVVYVFNFFLYLRVGENAYIPNWLCSALEVILVANCCINCCLLIGKKKNAFILAIYLIFVAVVAYICGAAYSERQITDVDINTDLLIFLLLIDSTYVLQFSHDVIIRFLKILIITSCLISIYELLKFDTSRIQIYIVDRSSLWDAKIFYCGPFFWCLQIIAFYCFVYKKDYAYLIMCWATALVISLIATKRDFLAESLWLFLVIMFFLFATNQKKRAWRFILSFICILFIIGIFLLCLKSFDFSLLFDKQIGRFSGDEMTSGYVRFAESENYFSNASIMDYIVGKGFGVPHHGLGQLLPNTALHIGVANYIFKFGLLLIVPYLYFLCCSLKNFFRIKDVYKKDKWMVVTTLTVISYVPEFFLLGNIWLLSPCICFFWYVLLYSCKRYVI